MWDTTPTSIYPITEGEEGEIGKEVIFKEIITKILSTGTLMHCRWEYTLIQLTWKTIWQQLLKLNQYIFYDPTIPSLGMYPKMRAYAYQKTCARFLITALFKIAKKLETNAHQQENE